MKRNGWVLLGVTIAVIAWWSFLQIPKDHGVPSTGREVWSPDEHILQTDAGKRGETRWYLVVVLGSMLGDRTYPFSGGSVCRITSLSTGETFKVDLSIPQVNLNGHPPSFKSYVKIQRREDIPAVKGGIPGTNLAVIVQENLPDSAVPPVLEH